MTAYAAPAPWYQAVAETTRSGRTKHTINSGNMQWDLSEGWHVKRGRGWIGKGKKTMVHTPDGKELPQVYEQTITGFDGKEYKLYKTRGYEDTIGFHSHANPDEDAMDYALNAFDKKDPSHGPIYEQAGCGHIAKIEYAKMQQVLRVTFVNNGSICVFFRVPSAVAATLMSHAESGATGVSKADGTTRHLLGMEFWDLVRIRGQIHGSRYPFEYLSRNRYKLTGSNRRYRVTLSDENIKLILGKKYYGRELKPGETIETVLSEEEYAKWKESLQEGGRSKEGLRQKTVDSKDKGKQVEEVDGVDMNYYAEHEVGKNIKTIQEILNPEDFARYNELENKIRLAKDAKTQEYIRQAETSLLGGSESSKKAAWAEAMKLAETDQRFWLHNRKSAGLDLDAITAYVMTKAQQQSEFVDKRFKQKSQNAVADMSYGKGEKKKNKGDIDVTMEGSYDVHYKKWVTDPKVTLKEAFDGDMAAINDYVRISKVLARQNAMPKYARAYIGRGWTIQELNDFANASIPGAISLAHQDAYKRLVQNHEYEAALDFLKNHKHDIYSNGKAIARNRSYASQYDFIVD